MSAFTAILALADTPGSIGGTVVRDQADASGVPVSLVVLPGMLVELLEGNRVVRTTQTDLNGRYQFTGLQQGTYEVRGTAPVHGVALRQVPLTPGAAVVVHFVVIPCKPLGIYASLAGTAVDPAVEINPDLDGSGMVDFEDLLVTHPHLGQPPRGVRRRCEQ